LPQLTDPEDLDEASCPRSKQLKSVKLAVGGKQRFPKRTVHVVVDGNVEDRGGTVSVVDGPASMIVNIR
jgi:hypothetical protein